MSNIEMDTIYFDFARSKTIVPIIAIYYNTSDFPGLYVARLFDINKPTPYMVKAQTMEELYERLPLGNMVKIQRAPCDDPVIVETWI